MAVLSINGVALPDPTQLTIEEFDLSTNARRALDGSFSYDFVAVKRRVEARWAVLTAAEVAAIRSSLPDGQFYEVELEDGTQLTCYRGDRSRGLDAARSVLINGQRLWVDVSLTLIEV